MLAAIWATGAHHAYAADHVLQAGASIGSLSVRDDLLVPVAFTGPALSVGLSYEVAEGPHRLGADLQAGIGVLWNRFDHQAEQLFHGLAASYGHTLGRHLVLGGVLRWHDDLSYLESWDDAHGYWLSQLVLGLTARDVRPISGGLVVETRAELAIFGLVSRPPGTRQNKQDALTHAGYHFDRLAAGTELAWIGNLQSARLESVLRLRAPGDAEGSGFGLGLFLTVERSTAAPESYTLLSIGLTVGFGWEL